jgi:Tetratricopeptide repeat
MGQWAEAKAAYEELLAREPDDLDGRLGHGLALVAVGDLAAGVLELDWVLDRAPDQIDARYNRAVAYSALGRDEDALADLDVLIGGDPEAWYYRSDRGAILLRLGQVDDAVAELRRAVTLALGEAAAHLNLGSALLAAGEVAEAHDHLARAALEWVPGAWTALRRARRQMFLSADRDAVQGMLGRLLSARSAADVAGIASTAPYLLSEDFLDLTESVIRDNPGNAEDLQWRLAELRRLAAGEEVTRISARGEPIRSRSRSGGP